MSAPKKQRHHMLATHDVKPVEVNLMDSTESTPEPANSQIDSHSFKSSINQELIPRTQSDMREVQNAQQVMATVEREDSDDDDGLSSDPDSIDDDALRSVDAFSTSDEDEDRD